MENTRTLQIAVVGGGVSGLAAIKSCLEEGLQPHCFEMDSDIGGVWYAPDSPKYGSGPQMYDSLITNTSKAMMCFSDFPCPASYPPYLPHHLFQKYLLSYAQHFNLRQHISFNTKVLDVRKAEDYDTTGRWKVITCRVKDMVEEEEKVSAEFDGVMLCQGFYSVPYTPAVPGLTDAFQGQVHHVSTYRRPAPFAGRTVLVVGSAASAGDVACDIAPVAKQVYLSTHGGAYNISRLSDGYLPLDFLMRRVLMNWVPQKLAEAALISKASKWLSPVTSGLKPRPSTPFAQVNFMINDQLPFKIMAGQIKVVAKVEQLTHRQEVVLEDGRILTDIDDIIFATGYKHDFNVVHPDVITSDPKRERLDLYKMIFPVSLPHDSLVLIGCLRANGPLPPIMEVQARLAARVIAGKHQLPDRAVMRQDIERMNKEQLQTHGCYKYGFTYLGVADTVAAELNIKPSFCHFLARGDLKMALAVLFGPAYPFHYRLIGPHRWDGARQATMNAYQETVFSTQHRNLWEEEERGKGGVWKILLLVVVPVLVGAASLWCC